MTVLLLITIALAYLKGARGNWLAYAAAILIGFLAAFAATALIGYLKVRRERAVASVDIGLLYAVFIEMRQLPDGHLEFLLRLFNGTGLKLFAEKSIDGHIHFNSKSLETPSLTTQRDDTGPKDCSTVIIHQRISAENAQEIGSLLNSNSPLSFQLSDLRIGLRFQGVDDQFTLPLPYAINCRKGITVGRVIQLSTAGAVKPTGTIV